MANRKGRKTVEAPVAPVVPVNTTPIVKSTFKGTVDLASLVRPIVAPVAPVAPVAESVAPVAPVAPVAESVAPVAPVAESTAIVSYGHVFTDDRKPIVDTRGMTDKQVSAALKDALPRFDVGSTTIPEGLSVDALVMVTLSESIHMTKNQTVKVTNIMKRSSVSGVTTPAIPATQDYNDKRAWRSNNDARSFHNTIAVVVRRGALDALVDALKRTEISGILGGLSYAVVA